MRQLISRNPSTKSLKQNSNTSNIYQNRPCLLKRSANDQNNPGLIKQSREKTLNIKKRKFLNVVSKQKDHSNQILHRSTVSLPAQKFLNSNDHSRITQYIGISRNIHINPNENSFLQRRSQSCASIRFQPSNRHSINTTIRPIPMLIKQRIVPIPMHFQYNSPNQNNQQFRIPMSSHFKSTNANNHIHFNNLSLPYSINNVNTSNFMSNIDSFKGTNLNHFKSSFQVLPSKQQILFCNGNASGGYNSCKQVQKNRKSIVYNNPIQDFSLSLNAPQQNSRKCIGDYQVYQTGSSYQKNQRQMQPAKNFFNQIQRPLSNLEIYSSPQNFTHQAKSPSFGDNFYDYKAQTKESQQISGKQIKSTNQDVLTPPLVNSVTKQYSFKRKNTILENSNFNLMNQIDKSMSKIDKSIDKIKDKTQNALRKSVNQYKKTYKSQNQELVKQNIERKEFNKTKKFDENSLKKEIDFKDKKSSQLLNSLFKYSSDIQAENDIQIQNPQKQQNQKIEQNIQSQQQKQALQKSIKPQNVYESRVSHITHGSLSIKDQNQNISMSMFKQFKQFQQYKEYRQFKERINLYQKTKEKQNSNEMQSSRCGSACKHIRQLLDDYRQLRTLRQFSSIKKIKDRQSQKLKSSRKNSTKMYY